MDFMTIDKIAARRGITPRQVRAYCADNRIAGATLEQGEWRIRRSLPSHPSLRATNPTAPRLLSSLRPMSRNWG